MKITTVIPVYLSNSLLLDFTEQTLASLKTSHDNTILLVNNYCLPDLKEGLSKLGTVIDNPVGNSVPAAWNLGIKKAIENGSEYIFIPNNDLIFRNDSLDNLIKFAEEHKEMIMWTMAEHCDMRTLKTKEPENTFDEHPHFSAFMVHKSFPEQLGKLEEGTGEPYPGYFDEDLKVGYFEDGDMHQRLLRQGLKACKTASAWFYHFGSRTIKTDDDLNFQNAKTYEYNRAYFERKWGFNPHGQVHSNDDPVRFVYKKPFNN